MWKRQLGTTSIDTSNGVSADGLGNIYISGATTGSLGGPHAGGWDAFVGKYDSSGNLLWTRQLGTSKDDWSNGVSADGLGNVYISGTTSGSLKTPNAGGYDAFVSKYDAAGAFLWTQQIGTTQRDESFGVSADGLGNVYISGRTSGNLGGMNAGDLDAFLRKYDAAGNLIWAKQLGTWQVDESHGVSADGLGNVYITGSTRGDLGGINAGFYDAFVSKYGADGNRLWTRQLGTPSSTVNYVSDASYAVSADNLGNVYISGCTQGGLNGPSAGDFDAFVSKYDAAGTLLWTRQLGGPEFDLSYAVSADGRGNVYITGYTESNLAAPNAGDEDAFVSKYDADGRLVWTQQFGVIGSDYSRSMSVDDLGNVYISGSTQANLAGAHLGYDDAFVIKIKGSPNLGDFDGDGDADGADLIAWETNFPKTSGATTMMGDADGDGDVDGADFVVWQTNFSHSTSGVGAAAVWEPNASFLLMTGGVTMLTYKKRWRPKYELN